MFSSYFPDFIGIGGHRCGSTWLWEQLRQHPDVHMAPVKEVHYFDRKLNERLVGPLLRSVPLLSKAAYSHYFWGRSTAETIGEITPAYGIMPLEDVKMVARWMPDVKIIFSVRNPVPRTWSHARKDFTTLYGRPLEDASEKEIIAMLELPAVVERSSYVKILKKWQAVFPEDRIKCMAYEQIVTEPEALLHGIQDFIGVAHFTPPNLTRRVNARAQKPIPPAIEAYLRDHFLGQREELESLSGLKLDWE
ncbi:sulfotransferase family protein [Neolewinella antarctica]|uniref:Sulfotransferase n=1 Tax=Neolewinella antarctica TaxID=442734 RepID=A0ABX0XCH8_9BACT|nr:sulfotransferase [Neolewinella antarctica]NJC26661.1 hypothetical protein [Neolewinella antarctica]